MTSRSYCFTINNPDMYAAEYLETIHAALKADYTVGQLERGAEGTPHIQGCVWFKNSVRFTKIKKVIPTAHIEATKSLHDAIKYCKKEDSRLDGPY